MRRRMRIATGIRLLMVTLLATLGIGRAYIFVTIFYLASLALTFGVSKGRPVPDPSALPSRGAAMSLPRPSSWREMLDGLLYVWARPKMLATMWLAFLVNLTAYPAFGGLLPYVARNIYGADANGLGWLVASFSVGALLGSMRNGCAAGRTVCARKGRMAGCRWRSTVSWRI